MIRLNSTKTLQAVLAQDVTTDALDVSVGYSDMSAAGYLGDSVESQISGTAPNTILGAPLAETTRDIDFITIVNTDSVVATVTVQKDESGTTTNRTTFDLAPGDVLTWTHAGSWNVIGRDGSRKTTAGSVNFAFADDEVPAGLLNGSNTVFTLQHAPSPAESLKLFRNGMRQRLGSDFTLSTNAITYAVAPSSDDTHECDYRY